MEQRFRWIPVEDWEEELDEDMMVVLGKWWEVAFDSWV